MQSLVFDLLGMTATTHDVAKAQRGNAATAHAPDIEVTGPGDLEIHAAVYARKRFVVRKVRARGALACGRGAGARAAATRRLASLIDRGGWHQGRWSCGTLTKATQAPTFPSASALSYVSV